METLALPISYLVMGDNQSGSAASNVLTVASYALAR